MALFDRFKRKTKKEAPPKKAQVLRAPVSDEKKPKKETEEKRESTVTLAGKGSAYANVLMKPHVSEKSATLADRGIYVFVVPKEANKIEIGKAVEATYGVHVASVRTLRMKGKATGFGRRSPGRRKDWKKALVELKEGESLTLVEGV